ncbi:hypothetical protein Mapa_013896 [Marchantia paleacea]|nr:hypothetical protein Mapa_013896 [Marchantia paleacea]
MQLCHDFSTYSLQLLKLNISVTDRGSSTRRHYPELKLNDSVYELFRPENGDPLFEIVFLHGLQLTQLKTTAADAYKTNWMSACGSECWIQTFLPEAFQDRARVLSVSYDSSAVAGGKNKHYDLSLVGESLAESIIECPSANVGQKSGVPVILVAHSFGGFALQSMICNADDRLNGRHATERLRKFMSNLRGAFYYATPYREADFQTYLPHGRNTWWPWNWTTSPMVKSLEQLSDKGSRRNADFNCLRKRYNIRTSSIFETGVTKLIGRSLSAKLEKQSSGRDIDADHNYSMDADHFSICKPQDSTSDDRFLKLKDFIRDILPMDKAAQLEKPAEQLIAHTTQ